MTKCLYDLGLDLFLSLYETAYGNKLAFMYYYKFFKVVYEKITYKIQFLLVTTYKLP
jgi:hypothetical protein